jgi:ribosomal-protein-alanine N-acetyltransferase
MRPGDIEGIVPVEAELFAGDPPWTAEQFRSELAGMPDTRWYIVAEIDGRLAGYAGLMVVGGTADVQTLAVVPAFQRRGLGAALLEALIDEARDRRAGEVLLEVRADNAPALALYERHGFERIAIRRGYYGSGRYDGLVLRRRLRRTPKASNGSASSPTRDTKARG